MKWRIRQLEWQLVCPMAECRTEYTVTIDVDHPIPSVSQCSRCHAMLDTSVGLAYLELLRAHATWQEVQ